MRGIPAALLVLLAAAPAGAIGPAPREPADLSVGRPRARLDRRGALVVAGGAALAWGLGAAIGAGGDRGACRWCEPGPTDLRIRETLRWKDTASAAEASDVLRLSVPLGSAAAVAWLAARDGDRAEIVEDVLAVVGAVAITGALTDSVKHGAARRRPGSWAAGGPAGGTDLHSFFSSHTSRVFAASAAATQVARLRGRPGWGWLAAAGLAASASTAWLRVASDQHWASDVLAAATAGTAVGLAVPSLMMRGTGRRRASFAPAPGGLALVF